MGFHSQPLGQIARDIPGAGALFNRLNLNYCCGGDKTLADAAEKRGMDVELLVAALDKLGSDRKTAVDVAELDDQQLIEHILTRYHDALREQLPELIRLACRVERVHAGHPDCPAGLHSHLEKMQEDLEAHMAKEEQILFPMIARGVHGMAVAPVMIMRQDHDDHGEALNGILLLTHDLTLPEGACNTWQQLYTGLDELRRDLIEHIHLENNVLFYRIDGKPKRVVLPE
ncbi:iron-sulfur cluster repair protein YtfE [Marinobacter sp. 1Y8]